MSKYIEKIGWEEPKMGMGYQYYTPVPQEPVFLPPPYRPPPMDTDWLFHSTNPYQKNKHNENVTFDGTKCWLQRENEQNATEVNGMVDLNNFCKIY